MNLTRGRVIGLSFLATAILVALVFALNGSGTTGCKSEWVKCADKSKFDLSRVRSACKREAAKRARYGTPEWPEFPFMLSRADIDPVLTGIVKLLEEYAKFQNVYGAMARSRVDCEYDLLADRVTDLTISEW